MAIISGNSNMAAIKTLVTPNLLLIFTFVWLLSSYFILKFQSGGHMSTEIKNDLILELHWPINMVLVLIYIILAFSSRRGQLWIVSLFCVLPTWWDAVFINTECLQQQWLQEANMLLWFLFSMIPVAEITLTCDSLETIRLRKYRWKEKIDLIVIRV